MPITKRSEKHCNGSRNAAMGTNKGGWVMSVKTFFRGAVFGIVISAAAAVYAPDMVRSAQRWINPIPPAMAAPPEFIEYVRQCPVLANDASDIHAIVHALPVAVRKQIVNPPATPRRKPCNAALKEAGMCQ